MVKTENLSCLIEHGNEPREDELVVIVIIMLVVG